MGQEEADLSTIWVALGMARDSFAIAARANRFREHSWERVNEMQLVRDKVENRIRMLDELKEYDYGL